MIEIEINIHKRWFFIQVLK